MIGQRRTQGDVCGERLFRFTDKNGQEVVQNGGKCVFKRALAASSFESYEKLQSDRDAWVEKFIVKKKFDRKFGFTRDHHYAMPEREEFKAGFACSNILPSFPNGHKIDHKTRMVFDKDLGDWRFSTLLDRVCNPEFNPGIFTFRIKF